MLIELRFEMFWELLNFGYRVLMYFGYRYILGIDIFLVSTYFGYRHIFGIDIFWVSTYFWYRHIMGIAIDIFWVSILSPCFGYRQVSMNKFLNHVSLSIYIVLPTPLVLNSVYRLIQYKCTYIWIRSLSNQDCNNNIFSKFLLLYFI